MDDVTLPPELNRAGRRAEARKGRLRKAGAALATVPAAMGTTALLLGAASTSVGAATQWTVTKLADTNDGTCDADCSLREALAAAADGDTIIFTAGLTGDIDLGSELTVDASVDIQGPGATVIAIDGQDTHRIFNVSTEGGASGHFIVSGLTLKDGRASGGGAVLDANEDLTFTDVVFDGNFSTAQGGAVHSNNSNADIVVTNSTFSQNGASDEGAALKMRNGDSLTITNSTFTGNTAGATSAGGALYVRSIHGPVVISGSHFDHNAAYSGGAAAIWYSDIDVAISDSTFDQNFAVGSAGGSLYLYDLDTVTISGTQVTNSSAADSGGGAKVEYGTLNISDSVFSGNTTDGDGGGLYAGYSEGPTTISSSTFAGNSSGDDGGGIVWYYNRGPLTLRNSTLSGNTADSTGGGIYLASPYAEATEATVAILNSTISGNSAGEEGGGITAESYYGVDIVQTTITANTAPVGAGLFIPESTGKSLEAPKVPALASESGHVAAPRTRAEGEFAVTATGSIIAQNVGTDVEEGGTLTAADSIIGTVVGTTLVTNNPGLVGVNPLLGPLADNGGPTQTHALLPGSPAINAGPNPLNPFSGSDFDQRGDGYARVVAGVVDVGAYEVQPVQLEPTFTG